MADGGWRMAEPSRAVGPSAIRHLPSAICHPPSAIGAKPPARSRHRAKRPILRAVITYLKVRNLAIVEELEIEPGSGLNVLTGETGAGKSLLIDSLEFLRGARGSTEMIRAGAEKMSAEAEVGDRIVKREIAANGRGRVSIDGSLFSVRELESAMEPLLEIHGQSESHH